MILRLYFSRLFIKKGVIKMVLGLQDIIQEAVLAALESGETKVIISGDIKEFSEVLTYMGYSYSYQEQEKIIVHW